LGAKEPDRQGSCPILEGRNLSIVVALDVENDPAGFENACLWIRRLHILGVAPLSAAHNVETSFVLRSCRFDPLMAGVIGKIAFDHPRADDNHSVKMAQNSKNWKSWRDGNVWLAADSGVAPNLGKGLWS
jgi:hypothetical protein